MADVTVTITPDAKRNSYQLNVKVGDQVSFHADGTDAVLCVDSDTIFGRTRYEIPDTAILTLTVQPGASRTFDFICRIGDLDASCRGRRETGGEGSGKVEGGPD